MWLSASGCSQVGDHLHLLRRHARQLVGVLPRSGSGGSGSAAGRCRARPGRRRRVGADRAAVPVDDRRARVRVGLRSGRCPSRPRRRASGRRRRPGCGSEAPIVRASTSACQVVTWWSPKPTFISTSCGGRVRQRVVGHPVRVAVRLAAVPEHLDQRERERLRHRVGVGRLEDRRVGVEVDRAVEQDRVVHRRHAERRAGEVGRDRGQRAAQDPALAVAVVVEAGGVDRGGLAGSAWFTRNAVLLANPSGWIIRRPRKSSSEEPLLHAVGRAAGSSRGPEDRCWRCWRCPAFENPIVSVAQKTKLCVWPSGFCGFERRPRWRCRAGRARRADGRAGVAPCPRPRRAGSCSGSWPSRCRSGPAGRSSPSWNCRRAGVAVRRQVAGDLEGAVDAARHVRVLGRGELLDLVDGERRRGALHGHVGQRSCRRAGRTRRRASSAPPGDVLVAGDREVPGEVEVGALDLRVAQLLEDLARSACAGSSIACLLEGRSSR